MSDFSISSKRNDTFFGFAVAIAFGLWGTLLWAAPFYVGFSGPGKWVCWVLGAVCLSIALLGTVVEFGRLYEGTQAFKMSLIALVFLLPATLGHLFTLYVPLTDHTFLGPIYAVLRIGVLIFVALGLPFVLFAVAYVFDEARRPVNRTQATLTVLSFASALLPILAAVVGALWK